MVEAFACGEKTSGKGKAKRTGSLMVLDARNSSCEEEEVWKAAVRLV